MLIEAAKGGHTNVVSYLLDYPNNILSVPAPDLSQLTPPSHDTSQVSVNIHSLTVTTNYHLLQLLNALIYGNTNLWSVCYMNVLYNSLHLFNSVNSVWHTGPSSPIPSSGYGGAPPGARQSALHHPHAPTSYKQRLVCLEKWKNIHMWLGILFKSHFWKSISVW